MFALDANVLLNLYGYSEQTREGLLAILEGLVPRLRMPHQFALEYQRNRARAIMEQVKNYARVEKQLDSLYKEEFAPTYKHPFLSTERIKEFSGIQTELKESRSNLERLFQKDPYFERVSTMVSHCSSPPSPEEIEKLHEDAKKRYASRIPPGYAD